jgi:hypothetical protein
MIPLETATPALRPHRKTRRRRIRRPDSLAMGAHAASAGGALARYVARDGASREVLALDGASGSVLVIDRDAASGRDARLVAHLAPDEPRANAQIACEAYVRRVRQEPIRCRRLLAEDLSSPGELGPEEQRIAQAPPDAEVTDRHGNAYHLEAVDGGMSIRELRWRRHLAAAGDGLAETVSVREAVASVEAYEPIRMLTRLAVAQRAGRDAGPASVATLRLELERVLRSPIVLNRRLRERLLAVSDEQGLSMSEIAIRCGRVKRDRAGNISGETSWLARRIGLLPEGGRDAPTPWIHTDVLALIARRGLGVSPREVEPD